LLFLYGKAFPIPKGSSVSDPSAFLLQPANARPTGSATKAIQELDDVSVKRDGLAGCVKPS